MPSLVLRFVHILDKFIDFPIEFRRWRNGANALNGGPQLLHFQHNQVSGEFLAPKAQFRSSVIHVAKVRPNPLPYELPKCFCPFNI